MAQLRGPSQRRPRQLGGPPQNPAGQKEASPAACKRKRDGRPAQSGRLRASPAGSGGAYRRVRLHLMRTERPAVEEAGRSKTANRGKSIPVESPESMSTFDAGDRAVAGHAQPGAEPIILRRPGVTLAVPRFRSGHTPSPLERFVSKLAFPDCGCWIWTGTVVRGYGQISIDGKGVRTHRFAYEALVGPIPEGLQLDHLCRTPLCGNPDHLEPVTAQVNTLRGNSIQAENAAKTHCKWGHPLSGENLLILPGHRYCRTCRRRVQAEFARNKRAALKEAQVV